jgi:hypothetical protein
MTLPTRQQPNLRFPDQRSIASCLFYFILETSRTREELERSWEAIAHDIEIQDQREALQRKAQNRPPQ